MYQPNIQKLPSTNKSKNMRCPICRQNKQVHHVDNESGMIACSKCFGTNVWHSQDQNKQKRNVEDIFEHMTLGVRRNVK